LEAQQELRRSRPRRRVIGLSEAHEALGFRWDGKDESEFETIVETFKELFKTHVSIDADHECVNLIGAVDEDED